MRIWFKGPSNFCLYIIYPRIICYFIASWQPCHIYYLFLRCWTSYDLLSFFKRRFKPKKLVVMLIDSCSFIVKHDYFSWSEWQVGGLCWTWWMEWWKPGTLWICRYKGSAIWSQQFYLIYHHILPGQIQICWKLAMEAWLTRSIVLILASGLWWRSLLWSVLYWYSFGIYDWIGKISFICYYFYLFF